MTRKRNDTTSEAYERRGIRCCFASCVKKTLGLGGLVPLCFKPVFFVLQLLNEETAPIFRF